MPHPVIDLIQTRKTTGSTPNSRKDRFKVALIIEGGGMRGVVAGGMVTGLQELGLTSSFDAVFGTSAGALAGAYFLAGQSEEGTSIYYENLIDKNFIDFKRPLKCKNLISIEYLLDDVMDNLKPLNYQNILEGNIPLFPIATDTASFKSVVLKDFDSSAELKEALRASSKIPLASGKPVIFREASYVDGSVAEPIPFASAFDSGYTHLLVLLTRPKGVLKDPVSRLERRLIYPLMNKQTPGLGDAHLGGPENYADDLDFLKRNPWAYPVQLRFLEISQLEQKPDVLRLGVRAGAEIIHNIFTS